MGDGDRNRGRDRYRDSSRHGGRRDHAKSDRDSRDRGRDSRGTIALTDTIAERSPVQNPGAMIVPWGPIKSVLSKFGTQLVPGDPEDPEVPVLVPDLFQEIPDLVPEIPGPVPGILEVPA